jgi:hypothetical protein
MKFNARTSMRAGVCDTACVREIEREREERTRARARSRSHVCAQGDLCARKGICVRAHLSVKSMRCCALETEVRRCS